MQRWEGQPVRDVYKRQIMAFAKMRRKASEEGYMTPEEIDAEIAAARREKRGEQG